jgi:hypothetical protein
MSLLTTQQAVAGTNIPNNSQRLYLHISFLEWLLLFSHLNIIVWFSDRGFMHCLRFEVEIPLLSPTVPANECVLAVYDLKRRVFFFTKDFTNKRQRFWRGKLLIEWPSDIDVFPTPITRIRKSDNRYFSHSKSPRRSTVPHLQGPSIRVFGNGL